MADATLVQRIEKALGREVPKAHDVDDRYIAQSADSADVSDGTGSVVESAWSTFQSMDGDMVLISICVLAALVILLTFLVFRLAKRNRRMAQSTMFENTHLGSLSLKKETFLLFRRQSPKDKAYREFQKELRSLVEKHQKKDGLEIRFQEGTRDQ